MAIFPILHTEGLVQVGDKTRLNAMLSYKTASEDAVTLVEINPNGGGTWYAVTGSSSDDWFLDWTYTSAATLTPTVRITTSGAAVSASGALEIVTADSDNLFSSDSDLTSWEPDLAKYFPVGRSSFKNVHREAQKQILDWLDRHEMWDSSDNRLTSSAVVDVQEVKEWSKFLTLQIIFEGLANAVDDIFAKKSGKYATLAETARARAQIKLDRNNDGSADKGERQVFNSVRIVRS